VNKYVTLSVGIGLLIIAACSISRPVKKLTVPLPCYEQIQSLKDGWNQNKQSGYYEIDTAKFPNDEVLGWCYKKLSPDKFQSVFGAATKVEEYVRGRKLWYYTQSNDKHLSRVEVWYNRDSLFQINYYDCSSVENRIKQGVRFDPIKGHYVISPELHNRKLRQLGFCLLGLDRETIGNIMGQPDFESKKHNRWLYFTKKVPKGKDTRTAPRFVIQFDTNWQLTDTHYYPGVEIEDN